MGCGGGRGGLLVASRWQRVDLAALGGVLVYAVGSFAAGVYVLFHLGDGRWGGDAHQRLVAPSLAGTPMIGQFLQPVDGLLSGLADGVNEFNDVQAALPVAAGFLATAGWAFAIGAPVHRVARGGVLRLTASEGRVRACHAAGQGPQR